MKKAKKALVSSAIELVQIGKRLETARGKLRQLVESGVPYDSDEMKEALQACMALNLQWSALEQRHLALKGELQGNNADSNNKNVSRDPSP